MPTLLEKIQASAAKHLTLPPRRLPAQELDHYKDFLKIETHRLKILHRAGGGGREVCRARSAIIDLLLGYILEGIKTNSPALVGKKLPVLTLVALGGYGRAELNPHSDLDIMFLHDGEMVTHGKANPALAELVDGVLYTLWDLGLKIGHSVRSIDDCVKVANGDMQSKTSLIEARRIMGDEALFDRFERVVLAKCVRDHEDEYVKARLQDQEARRAKFGNSACMQEPNIKNGCGGLRDYQNLVWLAFFKYRTRSLADLQRKEMISESECRQLEAAYDFLLRARNELHYYINRPTDALLKSMQPSIATNLGFHERSPSKRLELFMHDFYTHARNIDLITRTLERRLALVPQPSLLPSFKELFRSQSRRIRQQLIDGFKCLDGELYPLATNIFRENPRRLMRAFLYAQQRGLKLHPDTAQLIRNQLSLANREFLRDAHVRETFLEILDQRGNVAPVLRAMHEVGFLGKFLPEFGRLTCLVQHEFYHQYTADEHTLVCVEKLDQLWKAKDPSGKPYAEIFQIVERPFLLYLALLLHDSGKPFHTGKHSDMSAKLALRAARRLGLDGANTHSLRLLIEHHLTMVSVSQRRDLDDPSVIRNFARQIQSEQNLIMLTLHSLADSLGTSNALWNGFKDAALWALFHRARRLLAGQPEFTVAETRQRDLLAQEVRRIVPATFEPEEIQAHFEKLPPRYFQINDAREIARDLVDVHRFFQLQVADKDENVLAPIISWHDEPDRGYTAVTVCTWDRERLFSNVTGSLTAVGLNILSAEILTRDDGVIIDTFFVVDAKTGLLAKREEGDKFEPLLRKILTGNAVDLPALIAKRKSAVPALYKSIEEDRIPTVIHFDNITSENRTIIDIEAEDRIGLLYDISQALADLKLDISLAKILTEKGAAIDSLYVAEKNAGKVFDPERKKNIERKLRQAIGSPALPAVAGKT